MPVTNEFADLVLECVFGDGHDSRFPDTWELALYDNDPSTTGVELSGSGYARLDVPNDDANWTAPAGSVVQNILDLRFDPATADWLPVQYFGLCSPDLDDRLQISGRINGLFAPNTESGSFFLIHPGVIAVRVRDIAFVGV